MKRNYIISCLAIALSFGESMCSHYDLDKQRPGISQDRTERLQRVEATSPRIGDDNGASPCPSPSNSAQQTSPAPRTPFSMTPTSVSALKAADTAIVTSANGSSPPPRARSFSPMQLETIESSIEKPSPCWNDNEKIAIPSLILNAFLCIGGRILDQEQQLKAEGKYIDPELVNSYRTLQDYIKKRIQQSQSYNRFIRSEEYRKYDISNRAWDHFMYCYVRLEFDDTDIHDLAEIKPILDLYNADILKTSHTTLYIFDILSAFSYQQEGLVKLCSIINAKKDPEASDAAKAIKLIFQAAPFVVSKAPDTPKKAKEELISKLNELNLLIQRRMTYGHPVIQLSDKPILNMLQAFSDSYRKEDRSSNIWWS